MDKRYIIVLAATVGVYLFMKFLSPIFSPFILAFLLAGLLGKLTRRLPLKMKKSFLAGILLFLFFGAVLFLFWVLGALVVQKGGEIAGQFSGCGEQLCAFLGSCCDFVESSFGIDGKAVESYILEQVNIFVENLEVNIWPAIMNKSMSYAKNAVGFAGFFVVTVIAVFLMLKDYEQIVEMIRKNKDFDGVREVTGKIVVYLKTYLKAQVTILLIISGVCGVTLGIIGIKGGVAYGIVTGFMDTLPFVGTGIMLVPLAFFRLMEKNYIQAGVILCLYVVCALLREFLEPRLIGSKVGIWPVGILFSVFAGVRLFGIFGIIKGPLGLVIICETCKYLFRTKEESC